jgi:hypothetical protein
MLMVALSGNWFSEGRVAFLDEEREVDIHITEAPETLVGLALLQGYRLILDGDTHQVRFKRKRRR